MLPLVTPPPLVRLRLRLSSHRCLSLCPSRASCPAGCPVASRHTAVSHPPAPPPLIATPPIIVPLLCLLSGWLLHYLSSRCHLLSACISASHPASCPAGCCVTSCHTAVSASHGTTASHSTPLAPLIQLVVASPLITPPPPVPLRLRLSAHRYLIPRPSHDKRRESLTPLIRVVVTLHLVMPPPPVHLRLCLSLHHHLSLRPSCASYLHVCCIASRHAAPSHPPAPPPLIAPPPLTAPLLHLLSGWLLCHFSSHHHIPPACASASHRAPILPLRGRYGEVQQSTKGWQWLQLQQWQPWWR